MMNDGITNTILVVAPISEFSDCRQVDLIEEIGFTYCPAYGAFDLRSREQRSIKQGDVDAEQRLQLRRLLG